MNTGTTLDTTIRRLSALTAALLLVGTATTAVAGNPQRGLEKSQVCQSCHGRNGDEALQDDYPILAGQHADYLEHALRSYRDGTRENAIMAGFAATLSDQDIADLAAWYASQDGLTELSFD
ncbi:cytochrome c [Wenzhouxiangella sp. XN79A]|uniref:c-type cytochrome n=1 Tax=Wenzhouxiangella sp. XN79A TaxID=2724193 RepID=UPI00144AAAF5|nr:cytochrome c [Wenzhouxiangella sp. XN79A]NKI35523.1 cytochrome c [Wenzhouxiangella sp. XN79A]